MALFKAVVGLLLIIAVISGSFWFYQNFKGQTQLLEAQNYDPSTGAVKISDLKSTANQFYENMRFNHNQISYFANSNCDSNKKGKVISAFKILSEITNNKITFYETTEDKADILIGCSANSYEREKNIFIAGEGGPTKIVNSSMPVIVRGKILIYNESLADCKEPLLELHELIHVFGYDHVSDSSKLMYPYLNCNQKIGDDFISHINKLYSISPYADVYFKSINATKEKYGGLWYLNFDMSVINYGIIKAENVILSVYNRDKLIDSFDLDNLDLGAGKNFYIKNLKLSGNPDSIRFELKTNTIENNVINNILELKVSS